MPLLLFARPAGRLKPVLPLALLTAVLAAGCDTVPGPASLDNQPPLVSNLSYAPGVIDPGGDGEQFPITEGIVAVPLTVQATAVDLDGDIADVLFVLESPELGRQAVASGRMAPVGEGRYEAATTASLPVEQPGLYSLVVYATDDQGRLSNQVRGSVRLVASPNAEVGRE